VERQKYFSQINIKPKLFYIVLIILYFDEEEKNIKKVIDRYGLPDRIEDWIKKGKKLKMELLKTENPSVSKLYDILKRPQDEIIVAVDSWFSKEMSEKIRTYFVLYEKNKPSMTGKDLIEHFNLEEGPQIREILNALYKARIEGLPENKEKEFVEEYLKGGM
jgi:tRNA nucleotidyltransferase (CCA-adding enzyme)